MGWDQARVWKENPVEVGTAVWSMAMAMDCAAVKYNACFGFQMVCQEWAVNEQLSQNGENLCKKLQSILERLSWDNFSFYQRRLLLMGFCLFINYLSGENTLSIF